MAASLAPAAVDSPSTPTKPKPAKRRPRSNSPGVVLVPPLPTSNRRRTWSMRWDDPDTRRRRSQRIPTAVATDAGERIAKQAAFAKSQAIEARKLALQLGAKPERGHTVATEIARYLDEAARSVDKTGRLMSPITLAAYKKSLNTFARWLATARVHKLEQITQTHVSDYRTARMAVRSKRNGEPRKNSTVNQDLKPVRQMLAAAQAHGRLKTLTPAELGGALERLTEPDPVIRCLTPEEIRTTLRAALAYDADARFGTTRMAPVIALGLLTGCRRAELAGLQVRDVLLECATAGETMDLILVPKALTKTGQDRDVAATGYSPLMAELLRELVADREPDELLLNAEYDAIGDAMAGLIEHGAPADFCCKAMRSTCCSYLLPLPGDLQRKAKRAGHTLTIAEKHYLALPRGIALTAPSIEVAMCCEVELQLVIAALRGTEPQP